MNDTLDELLPALRDAIDDPDVDVETLSRLTGLVLHEVAQARRLPPAVARRSASGLLREARERTPGNDPQEEVRTHARMVVDLASKVCS